MEDIPPPGPVRDRLINEHRECMESMIGVAGSCCLKNEVQGDTTVWGGGLHTDPVLRRVLMRMRAQPVKGKLIIVCTKVEKEWRIARLSGIRGVPPEFVNDKVYTDEQMIQHDIFLMRFEEMAQKDGFPENYREGWKRRDDNWAVT
jgi:hypothetical protein